MRHSTGTPTKAEKARMDAIKDGPCVCCAYLELPSAWPEIHHLLSGNRRRGHMYTVGLCPYHHRGVNSGLLARNPDAAMGPSLAHGSKPFHAAFFGTDDAMLEYQNRLLGIET